MISGGVETVMACFLVTSVMLAASSRMLHCVRIMAVQGILLGVLPLLLHGGEDMHSSQIIISITNIAVKGIALPLLVWYAVLKAKVKRELEPLVGYAASLVIVLGLLIISFVLTAKLPMPGDGVRLVMPVAFTAMLTGLFMVIARRKAITQAIGFLTFENGIALFGTGMMIECGLAVELGILLDVMVLVIVTGIAVARINREFSHINSDEMHQLGDAPEESEDEKEMLL